MSDPSEQVRSDHRAKRLFEHLREVTEVSKIDGRARLKVGLGGAPVAPRGIQSAG